MRNFGLISTACKHMHPYKSPASVTAHAIRCLAAFGQDMHRTDRARRPDSVRVLLLYPHAKGVRVLYML